MNLPAFLDEDWRSNAHAFRDHLNPIIKLIHELRLPNRIHSIHSLEIVVDIQRLVEYLIEQHNAGLQAQPDLAKAFYREHLPAGPGFYLSPNDVVNHLDLKDGFDPVQEVFFDEDSESNGEPGIFACFCNGPRGYETYTGSIKLEELAQLRFDTVATVSVDAADLLPQRYFDAIEDAQITHGFEHLTFHVRDIDASLQWTDLVALHYEHQKIQDLMQLVQTLDQDYLTFLGLNQYALAEHSASWRHELSEHDYYVQHTSFRLLEDRLGVGRSMRLQADEVALFIQRFSIEMPSALDYRYVPEVKLTGYKLKKNGLPSKRQASLSLKTGTTLLEQGITNLDRKRVCPHPVPSFVEPPDNLVNDTMDSSEICALVAEMRFMTHHSDIFDVDHPFDHPLSLFDEQGVLMSHKFVEGIRENIAPHVARADGATPEKPQIQLHLIRKVHGGPEGGFKWFPSVPTAISEHAYRHPDKYHAACEDAGFNALDLGKGYLKNAWINHLISIDSPAINTPDVLCAALDTKTFMTVATTALEIHIARHLVDQLSTDFTVTTFKNEGLVHKINQQSEHSLQRALARNKAFVEDRIPTDDLLSQLSFDRKDHLMLLNGDILRIDAIERASGASFDVTYTKTQVKGSGYHKVAKTDNWHMDTLPTAVKVPDTWPRHASGAPRRKVRGQLALYEQLFPNHCPDQDDSPRPV